MILVFIRSHSKNIFTTIKEGVYEFRVDYFKWKRMILLYNNICLYFEFECRK